MISASLKEINKYIPNYYKLFSAKDVIFINTTDNELDRVYPNLTRICGNLTSLKNLGKKITYINLPKFNSELTELKGLPIKYIIMEGFNGNIPKLLNEKVPTNEIHKRMTHMLEPLRGAPIKFFHIKNFEGGLDALSSSPVEYINIFSTYNLKALSNVPIEKFICERIYSLEGINKTIKEIFIEQFFGDNLEPLRGAPIKIICIDRLYDVRDLEPLRGAPIKKIVMSYYYGDSIEPLRGAPITSLYMQYFKGDLSPIFEAPIKYMFTASTLHNEFLDLRKSYFLEKN